jgi:energy-coupling factor transporter ATP-binding protein EcfA2
MERLLEARRLLWQRLEERLPGHIVERFDPARYNPNLPVGENLLFGSPLDGPLDVSHLAAEPYIHAVLRRTGLEAPLIEVGRRVAATMLELFADLPPDHEFYRQFSFIAAEEMPAFRAILDRADRLGAERLGEAERNRLLALAFKLVEPRHRLGLITPALARSIVEARPLVAAELPAEFKSRIEFFDPERYNRAASIRDNVLFGSIPHGEVAAAARVHQIIGEVLEALGLRDLVVEVGLDHEVGSSGTRLSALERQKVAIARAVLKRPDLLILNEATAMLDAVSEGRIMAGLASEFEGRAIIGVLQRASLARGYGYVALLDHGRLVEAGKLADLEAPGSAFAQFAEAG